MKKIFTGLFCLCLGTVAFANSLCQNFSSEQDCHQDAYQSIIQYLQEDIQSENSSISPEEFQGKLAQYLPYDDFVSIFQKCENKYKERQLALHCIRNDVKEFILRTVPNVNAKKFLQDTLPYIVRDWDVESLEKYAINSKLVDDVKKRFNSSEVKQLSHSCIVDDLAEGEKAIDVDTGKYLYTYKASLSCEPQNTECRIMLMPTSEGYKYFNINCTILLGNFGNIEDYDVESFAELFEIVKEKTLKESEQ